MNYFGIVFDVGQERDSDLPHIRMTVSQPVNRESKKESFT